METMGVYCVWALKWIQIIHVTQYREQGQLRATRPFSLWRVSSLPSHEPIVLHTPYSFSPDLESFGHSWASATDLRLTLLS